MTDLIIASLDSAKWGARAEFYSVNDGLFYAVNIKFRCPEDQLRKHSNFKTNGQLVAPSRAIIIDAVLVQVIHRDQIQPSRHVFCYKPYPWTVGIGISTTGNAGSNCLFCQGDNPSWSKSSS